VNGINYFDKFQKVFVIAEAGVNHNGDVKKAFEMIEAAVNSGVDAIKFQTFKAEKLVSGIADMASYQKENIGRDISQLQMIRKLELSFDDFVELKAYCDRQGIMFLSTPFDEVSADFLTEMVPMFKIGSGEITNIPFLKRIAQKKKPIILSTGMSSLSEIETALSAMYCEGASDISLLHCTTNYPCPFNEVNLRAMLTIGEAFKLPIGYSDHTLGIEIPVAAVAMGAKIIEKHFTLDRQLPGPDHKASLEPEELTAMVKSIRNVEAALGDGIKRPNPSELETMIAARKSLVASKDLEKDQLLRPEDVCIKRPGNGLQPSLMSIVVGKKLRKCVKKDELFTWEHFMGDQDD